MFISPSVFYLGATDWFWTDRELKSLDGILLTFDSQVLAQCLETWKMFFRYLLDQSINDYIT